VKFGVLIVPVKWIAVAAIYFTVLVSSSPPSTILWASGSRSTTPATTAARHSCSPGARKSARHNRLEHKPRHVRQSSKDRISYETFSSPFSGRRCIVFGCSIGLAPGAICAQAAPSVPLVLAGGTVVDVTDWGHSAKDLPDAVVIIRDGRITNVGSRMAVFIPRTRG